MRRFAPDAVNARVTNRPAPFSGATVCFQGLARKFSAASSRSEGFAGWRRRAIEGLSKLLP
jgi:hypothetical protein